MARPKKKPSELRVDLRMRIPPQLKDAIEKAAKEAGQSITNWMEKAAQDRLVKKNKENQSMIRHSPPNVR